ncbi:histidine kinase dimerization/phosphoacceptor domain -containing protein [Halarcobacter anaerophilus]|uniref:histidine kinase dimerization/phosphoacceptor domain -containing protein n=1 Tax=Halarcobacter anaerophilus TaxID=877500 RepID=UPI0012FEA7F2|nr:histidine kinase dimerization/phosphoacceptor domain -containing protein [Halarcobacter anaerophilus]
MWINKNPSNIDLNTPISIIDNEKNKTYCVSKISNFRIPKSGELTLKEILEVKDTEHIYHKLEGKKSLTFISKINENKRDKFIFVLSAFEEDFKNNINSPIMKILPLSIVALLISILFGVFIFKRWIKNIEVLSNTAKKVKNGNLDTRSNVKGSDEFGVLGVTFDLMLDNLQDNIKNLDRKIDERTLELRQILRSKEILLRELNHRVKNNLFMIINFIKLQKSKTEDENIIQSLNTIENRIYSISLIHTKLFESKNFDFIDMKKYLTELITDISFTFDFSIKISLSIEQLNMDIENAMYCGLIVNELLTNSFKYAFVKNKENAKINITLKKLREKYYLMYKDNGVGLKGDVNINKCNSLGIKLINSISKNQLNGKIKIKSKNGLKFSILF